jgi:hypothetical protein
MNRITSFPAATARLCRRYPATFGGSLWTLMIGLIATGCLMFGSLTAFYIELVLLTAQVLMLSIVWTAEWHRNHKNTNPSTGP